MRGRKPKDDSERRRRSLRVCLSPVELASIRVAADAAGVPVSVWARRVLMRLVKIAEQQHKFNPHSPPVAPPDMS